MYSFSGKGILILMKVGVLSNLFELWKSWILFEFNAYLVESTEYLLKAFKVLFSVLE